MAWKPVFYLKLKILENKELVVVKLFNCLAFKICPFPTPSVYPEGMCPVFFI